MSEKTGIFISFEGGEGAGKTTQINRLAESLTQKKIKTITTREPGGTEEGEKIRQLLVQRDGGNWSQLSECLLFFAARAQLVEDVIKPAMETGKVVISDRFTDSTRAYQGYGRGFSLEKIERIKQAAIEGLEPDLTFYLDIEARAGLERSERRLASENLQINQTEDRFEKLDLSFHERLRDGYLALAKENPERIKVIDARRGVEEMAQEILSVTLNHLSEVKAG